MVYSHLPILVLLLLILEGLAGAVPAVEHSHGIVSQAQPQACLGLNSTRDQQIIPAVIVQCDATWNLARITVPGRFEIPGDRRGSMVDSQDFLYPYKDSAGRGVRIYILDYGVMGTHTEFQEEEGQSRVERGVDMGDLDNGRGDTDAVNHGTGVASVAAGKHFGIAKKARIIPVKLASNASLDRICDGLRWIIYDFESHKDGPGVINISVFLRSNEELLELLKDAIRLGLHVVTTAGNAGYNECEYEPKNVGQLHIGATAAGAFDHKWKHSNNGDCVTMYAPGADIWVAASKEDSNTAKFLQSGTSLSTPLVAGIIATIASDEPTLTPYEMKERLVNEGLNGYIHNLEDGDKNILLQSPVKSLPPGTVCLSDIASCP